MPTQPAVLGSARLNNFRLNYLSAALRAIRETRVLIWINGQPITPRVRLDGVTIQDDINDSPNTGSFRIEGTAPTVGQNVRITLNTNAPRLLFNGTLEAVDLTYEGRPDQLVWACSAQDDQARVAARLPFVTFTNESASTAVQYLVAMFAPAFTATHVQAGLPPVSVILDGSEGFGGALSQIAKLIGGYFYWEDGDLHFFLEEWAAAPDPIDLAHPFLDEPPITVRRDKSQLRTRVYGRGHSESLLSDVNAGETILPVGNAAAWFSVGGGLAVSTDELRLTYTGVQAGGLGSVVGPGAQPTAAPIAATTAGTGLGTGVYQYANTFVTAAGESLPGPRASVTTGPMAQPSSFPTLGAPNFGAGPNTGVHYWGVSFVAGSGETLATISTNSQTTYDLAPPAAGSVSIARLGADTPAGWAAGQVIRFRCTSEGLSGTETIVGPEWTHTIESTGFGDFWYPQLKAPTLMAGAIGISCYASRDGGASFHRIAASLVTGQTFAYHTGHPTLDTLPTPVGSTTATVHAVPLTTIPIGPAGTTARKIYRTAANAAYAYGNFKLATTIADNTSTSWTDTVADGSLGAAPPSSNTTALNRALVFGVAVGPPGTTARNLYRTAVNGSQLRFIGQYPDNTTTGTTTDSLADGSLGANAPITDTSGLSTVAGSVTAGSTTLLTSSATPFATTGGWVIVGGMLVRYTGISGNTLTGIPASGIGALINSVNYGQPVIAASALTGVAGLTRGLLRGATIHVWVQRDDLAAQAEIAAAEGTPERPSTGVYEYLVSDERRNEASLTALCDAYLTLYSRPIVTVTYDTRDIKTKSGKPIVIDLPDPPIEETLTIQSVTITELEIAEGVAPRFHVTASSVKYTLEALLRSLTGLVQD